MNANANMLQAMVDGMSIKWQEDRAESQMTLGKLIDRLKEMPHYIQIDAFNYAHSYRGYYCDLAFKRMEGKIKVAEALELCTSCMGDVYEGYKGGKFQMGRNTPVWFADYGSTGLKIIALRDDGTFELKEDE